jgi:hypothetical protein
VWLGARAHNRFSKHSLLPVTVMVAVSTVTTAFFLDSHIPSDHFSSSSQFNHDRKLPLCSTRNSQI